jgi:1-acyl-sn-glycerol-3-phosphate acyltransferase
MNKALKDFVCPILRATTSTVLAAMARIVTGVRPIWVGTGPSDRQRIYFANHTSHGDFILLSTCLPPEQRQRTRAAAAADYWGRTRLRRFIAEDMLGSVLVERSVADRHVDPMKVMLDVLARGDSLILFPEGTRNMTDKPLLKFRSGIYNLAVAHPDVELIPCWIENMSRVLPKGQFLPVPLLCRVIFGEPVTRGENEERIPFLARAHDALLSLKPATNGG